MTRKKNSLPVIITALLFFSCTSIYAQSPDTFKISGSIVSAISGVPVPDGTIGVENGITKMCDDK